MLLLFALALTGFISIGPIFFPVWFAWEEEITEIMLPFDYQWAKAATCIVWLLLAFFWYRKIQECHKRIFFNPKRADNGYLRLPKNNHNILMVVSVCMLTLFFLLTEYSQAIGGEATMVSIVKDKSTCELDLEPVTRYYG